MNSPRTPSARSALLTATLGLPTLLLAGLSFAQDGGKPAEKPQTAKQRYRNIKVLKDLPADQLIPVMRRWNASLGVKCDFCHVVQDDANGKHIGWEKDDKPAKNIARQMVIMTTDINRRNKAVHGSVTCFTCHRGHAEPEKEPVANAEKR